MGQAVESQRDWFDKQDKVRDGGNGYNNPWIREFNSSTGFDEEEK